MKFKGLCAAIMAAVTALSTTVPAFAAEATNSTKRAVPVKNSLTIG